MQDFAFGRMKAQEAQKEPYMLYHKEQQEEGLQNRATLRDFEYFRSMYPERLKALQMEVEKVCDEMEYKGSPMYDEYPDRVLMEQMCRKVEQRTTGLEQDLLLEDNSQMEMNEGMKGTEAFPRTPMGPTGYMEQAAPAQGFQTWEMNEEPEQSTMQIEERQERSWGSPQWGSSCPWGASCPWGPPPPRPWGPPPPHPWGPPPPPRPWGPPPPRPWGPPPPPRPWGPSRPGVQPRDVIDLLLFNEMQRRRCNHRGCR